MGHPLPWTPTVGNDRSEDVEQFDAIIIEQLGELGSMTHVSMEELIQRIRASRNTMHWLN